MPILCSHCKSPVYKVGDTYFHDVFIESSTQSSYYQRQLATIAREVKEYEEDSSQNPARTTVDYLN